MALLETNQKGVNANHQVSIKPTKPVFKVGQDYLQMTFFFEGFSGGIFQLFLNHKDSNNAITAQSKLKLPRPLWRIRANEAAGTDRFLAVVSNLPDTFVSLGLSAGPL